MNKKQLLKALDAIYSSTEDNAYAVLEAVVGNMYEDENIGEYDLEQRVYEEVSEYFIYYSDAWNYLMDEYISDFADAMREGCTDVCAIASYYLREAVIEYMQNLIDFAKDIDE